MKGVLEGSHKWVQALGSGQRNIAAAMVAATMNFGNDEVVMVVVYSLIGLVIMTPLALELRKRGAKKANKPPINRLIVLNWKSQ